MSDQVTQAAVLASEIGEAIGFSFADAEPGDEHLNDDGAWEHHFETDPSWGFIAAGPDGPIETTYPEWGEVEVPSYRWCVFHDGALAAMFSPTDGTVGGFVAIEGVDDVADLEDAMIDALQRERDALQDDEEIMTDGGFEIEREDCGRCGGTGQITEMVAGRSGLVLCPNCDNIPEHAVPADPPEDPEVRLAEIEARRDDLAEKKERAQDLWSDIHEARDLLSEAARSDLVPDETGTKFGHVTNQIEMLLRSFDVARGIHYEQDQLKREKAEVQTLVEHLDEPAAGEGQ